MSDEKGALLAGVDRAALVLAVVAGSVTFSMEEGPWTGFTTFVGLLLTFMVVGFHRAVGPEMTPRSILARLSFGLATALSLCIAAGLPVQFLTGRDVVAGPLMVIWFVVGAVVASFERHIASWLDGRSSSHRSLPRTLPTNP